VYDRKLDIVVLRIVVEVKEALCYKLRMMGVLLDGPTNGFCDNKSVITNSVVSQSTLNKKHNSIAYHKKYESQ
jgi:hypothetical protein